MLIEQIIFSLLAIALFIIIFFKIIIKNDSSYIYFLIIQFIGITLGFLEIMCGKNFSSIIKCVEYLFSIVFPFSIIILEKYNINIIEYLYIGIIRLIKIFNRNKAKKMLVNLVTKYPESYYGHKMLAEIYVKEGGRRKAIDEYVKVIDINKKDYNSYYKIAELLNELDKKDEAIQMLTTLVNKKKDYYEASILLGNLLCEKERFKEAINIYQNALKYYKTDYELYYYMGIAYTRLNDFRNAKECYDMAAQINANLYYAFYCLGIISLMFGEFNEAKKYLYEAIKGKSVEASAYYHLARICIIHGERENAINYLNTAIELQPKLAHKAIQDDLFNPIKKYIHIAQKDKKIEIEEKEKLTKLEDNTQKHLEKTYELAGNLSKIEVKKMNSFKKEGIEFRSKDMEREK